MPKKKTPEEARAEAVALGQIVREASAHLPQDDRFAWAFEG